MRFNRRFEVSHAFLQGREDGEFAARITNIGVLADSVHVRHFDIEDGSCSFLIDFPSVALHALPEDNLNLLADLERNSTAMKAGSRAI